MFVVVATDLSRQRETLFSVFLPLHVRYLCDVIQRPRITKAERGHGVERVERKALPRRGLPFRRLIVLRRTAQGHVGKQERPEVNYALHPFFFGRFRRKLLLPSFPLFQSFTTANEKFKREIKSNAAEYYSRLTE